MPNLRLVITSASGDEIRRDRALQLDKLRDKVQRGLGRHEAFRETEEGLFPGEVYGRREFRHRDYAGRVRGERFIAEITKCFDFLFH